MHVHYASAASQPSPHPTSTHVGVRPYYQSSHSRLRGGDPTLEGSGEPAQSPMPCTRAARMPNLPHSFSSGSVRPIPKAECGIVRHRASQGPQHCRVKRQLWRGKVWGHWQGIGLARSGGRPISAHGRAQGDLEVQQQVRRLLALERLGVP